MIFFGSRRMTLGYSSVLLLLVLVSVKGYAQGGAITWGKLSNEKLSKEAVFLKKDPITKYTYWLTTGTIEIFITTFDSNNVKIESKQLKFPEYNGVNATLFSLAKTIPLKDKILFLWRYNDEKMNLMHELIIQASLDGVVSENFIQFAHYSLPKGSFNFSIDDLVVTPDCSKIIANVFVPKQRGNDKARFIVCVYGADKMDLIQSGEYQVSDEYDFFYVSNNYIATAQSGDIIVLMPKPRGTTYLKDSVYYNVIQLHANSELVKELPLEGLAGKNIDGIGLTINRHGDIVISGFYKDYNSKLNRNYYNGVFMGEVKPNEPVKVKTTPFTNEEKLNFNSSDKTVKHVAKDNGGIILLSEQRIFNRAAPRYGNILIVDLDKDGTMKFAEILVKDQPFKYGRGYRNYYSYYYNYIQDKKELLIIYNNNLVGVEKNKHTYSMIPISPVPVLVVVDSKGVLTKSRIKLNEYESFRPSLTSATSDSEYVVNGGKGYEFRLGTLKISKAIIPDVQLSLPTDTVYTKNGYGFRLSGNDLFVRPKLFTGLNMVGVKSCLRKSNGVSIGLVTNKDSTVNGISYGTFVTLHQKLNGITLSPFIAMGKKTNGIVIAGLMAGGSDVNGVVVGAIGVASGGTLNGLAVGGAIFVNKFRGVGISLSHFASGLHEGLFCSIYSFIRPKGTHSVLKGVVVAGFVTGIDTVAGVTASMLLNKSKQHRGLAVGGINATKELHGVQLGFLNYAGNNPKALRLLPLVNMHLRR